MKITIESILEALRSGDQEEAVSLMEAASWSEEDMPGHLASGLSLLTTGFPDEAAAHLQEALLDIWERSFSTEERRQLAKQKKALPDGGFPIRDVQDLKNAIQAIGRAKNPSAAKAHIKRRAKALGASNLIPAEWGEAEEEPVPEVKAEPEPEETAQEPAEDEAEEAADMPMDMDMMAKKKGKGGKKSRKMMAEKVQCSCEGDDCVYEHVETIDEAPDEGMEYISESEGRIEESLGDSGMVYRVTLLQAGVSKNRNFWSQKLLESTYRMYEGTRAFADHPTRSEAAERPERSVRDIIGWYEGARYHSSVSGGRITANLHLMEGPVADIIKQAHAMGKSDLVQLSVNVSGKRQPRIVNGVMVREVTEIHRVQSVDAVTEASAGGSIDQIAASDRNTEEVQHLMDLDKIQPDEVRTLLSERSDLRESLKDLLKDEGKPEPEPQPEPVGKAEADGDGIRESVDELREELKNMRQTQAIARCERELEVKLQASGLPTKVQEAIRNRFAGKIFETAELEEEIKAGQELVASVKENDIPTTVPWARSASTGLDRVSLAMDGLVTGKPQKDADGNVVKPFMNLRHAYYEITGKSPFDQTGYEVLEAVRGYDSGLYNENVGRFQEATAMQRSDFGNGTLNKILGDSITRAALQEYRFPALNEWRNISRVVPVSDLRKQLREIVGEFTLVEDVGEAASAYPDLTATALPNQEAFYQAKKRGGMAALTLEAIINDDLRKLQDIPVKLGRAAAGRIYRTVFDLLKANPLESSYYTGGSGSITLFDTAAARAPGNLVTDTVSTNGTVVALNDANLSDAKLRFRIQQAATTGIAGKDTLSFLAAEPSRLVVSPTNETAAKKLLQGERMYATGVPTSAAAHEPDVNIHMGSLSLIVVPYWEVSANVSYGANTLAPKQMWFVLADPGDAPTIEVGFLNGRDDPEIFVQNSNTEGDMFNKDLVTWKVRHFWDANIMDHRAMVGATVS